MGQNMFLKKKTVLENDDKQKPTVSHLEIGWKGYFDVDEHSGVMLRNLV